MSGSRAGRARLAAAALAAGLALAAPSFARDAAAAPREYSVWLIPSEPARGELRKTIASLSRERGAPAFEPHVTLIGLGAVPGAADADVAARTAELARSLRPFVVELRRVGFGGAYFRSFYLEAEKTPELMRAGRLGLDFYRRVQGREPADPVYFPHLSLLYGDLSNAAKEAIIAADFGGKRERKIRFRVERLQLWATTGKPDGWALIREYRLDAGASKP